MAIFMAVTSFAFIIQCFQTFAREIPAPGRNGENLTAWLCRGGGMARLPGSDVKTAEIGEKARRESRITQLSHSSFSNRKVVSKYSLKVTDSRAARRSSFSLDWEMPTCSGFSRQPKITCMRFSNSAQK